MSVDLLIYSSDRASCGFIASYLTLLLLSFHAVQDPRSETAYGYTVRGLTLEAAAVIKQTIERNTSASITEI